MHVVIFALTKRKRRKAGQEYWDDPLLEPKIRNVESSENREKQQDEWVGLAGVDFFETNPRAI